MKSLERSQPKQRWSIVMLQRQRGSQLVEFSLVLPFLLVFLVGLSEFGNGYRTYQNLTNATREAARLSALPYYNQPSRSPDALRDRITNYLSSVGLDITQYQGSGSMISGTTAWVYGSYPDSSYLLIDQNKIFPRLDNSGSPTGIVYSGSKIEIKHPYHFTFFGPVMGLLSLGSTFPSDILIKSSTTIQNE